MVEEYLRINTCYELFHKIFAQIGIVELFRKFREVGQIVCKSELTLISFWKIMLEKEKKLNSVSMHGASNMLIAPVLLNLFK